MNEDVLELKKKKNYYSFNSARRKLKQKLVEYKGGKCEICGYDKCIDALEFHHLNPSEKEFTICSGDYKSFEKAKKEADKCILVCANCHREIHFQENLEKDRERKEKEKSMMIEIMNNREKYINEFHYVKNSSQYLKFTDILEEIKANVPRAEILKKYHINNRTFKKFLEENKITYSNKKTATHHPSKEELFDLLKNNSKSSIGRMFNVSCGAVAKWCKKYGI